MSDFFILNLLGLPIIEQLRLEEALLRADQRNWCLLNNGTPDAIVLGISSKIDQLVDQEAHKKNPVPLIRRFSGGGTVYVDQHTIFVTFIANEEATRVPCQPRKIMEWTESLYYPFFHPYPFKVEDNDYTMGDRKFGGNAQYVQKQRWLHHTSFLWDYESEKMNVLQLPQKRPIYRANRSHEHFLTKLSTYYQDKESFVQKLSTYLQKTLAAKELSLEEVLPIQQYPHRKVTHCLV